MMSRINKASRVMLWILILSALLTACIIYFIYSGYFNDGANQLESAYDNTGVSTAHEPKLNQKMNISLILSCAVIVALGEPVIAAKSQRAKTKTKKRLKGLRNSKNPMNAILRRRTLMEEVLHEIKTPLAVISGYAEMAIEEPDNTCMMLALKRIKEESRNVSWIMDFMSDIDCTNMANVCLKQLVEQCCSEYKAIGNDVAVIAGRDVIVVSDIKAVLKVLRCLVDNAIKYSDGSNVEVELIAEDEIRIEVRDFGIGIPAEQIEKIFDKGFRAGNVGAYPGGGIGLYWAKTIANHCKFDIVVESEFGKGSVFKIVFEERLLDSTLFF